MSGLVKSSSFRPEARSMARAPARLAPPIRAWLRNLGSGSLTLRSSQDLSVTDGGKKPCHSKSRLPRKAAATKTKGHHPDLDDGPNFSEVRLRHHPLLPLGTTTLRIRTTPGIVQTCKQTGAVRCCVVMALRVIKVAHTIRCGRLHVPPCKVAE